MNADQAPTTGDCNPDCPQPALRATPIRHFGRAAWEFECASATEVRVVGGGLEIHCAQRDQPCPVEDGETVFVNSPKISLIKGFLSITARYLGR